MTGLPNEEAQADSSNKEAGSTRRFIKIFPAFLKEKTVANKRACNMFSGTF